jgi:hypothetical protein
MSRDTDQRIRRVVDQHLALRSDTASQAGDGGRDGAVELDTVAFGGLLGRTRGGVRAQPVLDHREHAQIRIGHLRYGGCPAQRAAALWRGHERDADH